MGRTATPAPGSFAKAISAEIRAAMGRKRITGQELAYQIGRSGTYVSKRLRDELPFDLNDLDRIGRALGLDIHQLIARAESTVTEAKRLAEPED